MCMQTVCQESFGERCTVFLEFMFMQFVIFFVIKLKHTTVVPHTTNVIGSRLLFVEWNVCCVKHDFPYICMGNQLIQSWTINIKNTLVWTKFCPFISLSVNKPESLLTHSEINGQNLAKFNVFLSYLSISYILLVYNRPTWNITYFWWEKVQKQVKKNVHCVQQCSLCGSGPAVC